MSDKTPPAFIISRSGPAHGASCAAFEDALAARLSQAGARVLVLPPVYDLPPGQQAVRRLASVPLPWIVASWMHPRALLWTLAAHGVSVPPDAPNGDIRCVDLREFETPDAAFATLRPAVGPQAPAAASVETVLDETLRERWYPVIDRTRCRDCGKCANFCLFGVYSMVDGRLRVVAPDDCKPGCPACARLCPAGAILFPRCPDPAIAGAPAGGESNEAHALGERARCAAETASAASDLDGLIDALDRLDG